MVEKPRDPEDHWKWNKDVPIALIVTVILAIGGQALAFTIWAAKLDSRVTAIEERNRDRDMLKTRREDQLSDIARDIATLKANMEAAKDGQTDIKRSLDALIRQLIERQRSDNDQQK
jgi:Tfp pilus assembly protein PilO